MRAPFYSDDLATIYAGDVLAVLPELEGLEVKAVVTDPPYNSGGMFRGDRTGSALRKYASSDSSQQRDQVSFTGDSRDQRAFVFWCSLWLMQARTLCREGAVLAAFIDWRQLPAMTDAVQAAGWVWRGVGTWHKPGVRMQRGRLSGSSEHLVFGSNGAVVDHGGAPQSVFACAPVPVAERHHVAQKPLAVMRWALSLVPRDMPGVVLDPFCGSGSTLRACKDLGLACVGIDAMPEYCDSAARRLSQETLGLEGVA